MTETLELWQAVEAGNRAIAQVAEHAGDEFLTKARAHVLLVLENGPRTGEQLTDACLAKGIVPDNGDRRSFGPVIRTLSFTKQIEVCGEARRTKGHGSRGGSLWRLTQTPKL